MGKDSKTNFKMPLKVCIVNEFFFPDCEGGTGQTVSEIASKLSEAGVSVSVICGSRSYRSAHPLPTRDVWGDIYIRRVSYPNWNRTSVLRRSLCNIVFAVKAGIHLLLSERYDAVLVTTAPPFAPMAARILRIFRGTPYAYLIYDLEPNRTVSLKVVDAGSLPVRLLKRAQEKWLAGSKAVISIGRCMKSLIERDYGIESNRTTVVPVGADATTIVHTPFSPPVDRPFRLLYSGNLGRYHDFDAFLDCAKLLRDEPFEFRIVGRGAKREHVEARILKENIDNVRIDDFVSVDSYSSLLAWADACYVSMERGIEGTCVPSKSYSIMAAGRVIVASASVNTELAYTLEDHNCGVMVEPGDPLALATALRQLQSAPWQTASMASNGRQAFEEHYSTDTTVDSIRHLLYEVASRGVPSALPSVANRIVQPQVDEKERVLAADHGSVR